MSKRSAPAPTSSAPLHPEAGSDPTLPVRDTVPRLTVRVRRLRYRSELLALLPAGLGRDALCSWVRDGDGLVGWGVAARCDTVGPTRFADAESWWRDAVAAADVDDPVRLPGSGPVAFGSFAFSPGSPAGGVLVVPRIVVGQRGGATWCTTICHQGDVGGFGAINSEVGPGVAPDPAFPGEATFFDGALPGPAWQAAVERAVARIAVGSMDKVVLARDEVAESERPVDPRWLVRRLAADYPRTWVFHVDGLVGATPEMLLRLERGLVTSRVLAGTIRRTGDDDHDLALAASLARSSKDLEEHEYAVRSVAEALGPHCTSTNVPETPFVLHLPNVMHLATDVTGRLLNGATSLSLAASLHPSAAVCGTPREDAAALIDELEGMDRGRYAGPVGWVDDTGDGEWGIALRCGKMDRSDRRRLRLFAGCGIVAGSDPAAELAESDAKLMPMRGALADGPLAPPTSVLAT